MGNMEQEQKHNFLYRFSHHPIIALAILVISVAIFIPWRSTQTAVDQNKGKEQNVICSRTVMYDMPPEFQRALSLIIQRYSKKPDPSFETYKKMANCVNVQYSDIHSSQESTEGYFVFDIEHSSLERLNIYVDNTYSNYDDLTTAFLLSHELTHALQYVGEVVYNKKLSCVDKEAQAFEQQLFFQNYLNEEESKSIVARAEKADNNNPQLRGFVALIDYSWEAILEVNGGRRPLANRTYSKEETTQYQKLLEDKIRNMIVTNPAYKSQCGL